MSLERWTRVRDLFERAVEIEPPEREGFVERECSDDPSVQAEVRRLLANWSEDSNFLSPPSAAQWNEHAPAPAAPAVGERIGAYRIERVLGAGGMGTVYLAQQERPSRKVALKLMRAGLGSAEAERRFQAEAEILGRLRHPAIAVIHEFGAHTSATGVTPYFAMEYVEGASDLASHAKQERLDVRAKVALLRMACEAVQHAHGKGVIHRDLKPANVLVDANGTLKVIDFGVARIVGPDLAQSLGTLGGAVLGTVAYASPEQLQGDWRDIDVRTDVYSLGATLFELLAGRPPFATAERSLAGVVRDVCHEPAPRPSSIALDVAPELDWIVLKCLEKDREHRYATADELARDLQRFLDDEPVLAAPPAALYRLRKFVARNKLVVGASAVVLASLIGAVVVSSIKTLEADRQRVIATTAREASERDAEAARTALIDANEQRRVATEAVQTAEREAESARLALRRQAAIVDSLRSMLGAVSPEEDGRNVTLFELLERRRSTLDEEFADDPDLRVSLQQFLIGAYGNLGLATQGAEIAQSALATMQATGGYSSSQVSALQFFLARRYFEQGRNDEAAELIARAREVLRESGDGVNEDGVAALQMHAMMLEKRGEVDASIQAFREALSAARQTLGDEHVMTLMLMTDVALGLALRRQVEQAESLAREAYEGAKRVFPEGHSMLPLFTMRLGSVLTAAGKGSEAIELQRENLARTEAIFGEHHRNVAQVYREYASALLGAQRYDEAIDAAQHALELIQRYHASDAELELIVRGSLGGALQGAGRYADALDNWTRTVELFESSGRRADPFAMQARIGIGQGLIGLDRYADAEVSLRETLEVAADFLPPDDVTVGFARLLLAQCIAAQDQLAAGYDEMRAAYEILKLYSGPGPRRRTLVALEALANGAERLQRDEEHRQWRELLERFEEGVVER